MPVSPPAMPTCESASGAVHRHRPDLAPHDQEAELFKSQELAMARRGDPRCVNRPTCSACLFTSCLLKAVLLSTPAAILRVDGTTNTLSIHHNQRLSLVRALLIAALTSASSFSSCISFSRSSSARAACNAPDLQCKQTQANSQFRYHPRQASSGRLILDIRLA